MCFARSPLPRRGESEMRLFIDSLDGGEIKRGDILQTNVGDKRERTCMVLRVHRSRTKRNRFHVWAERWWQMEPELRVALFRSAERAGGQQVIYFRRYKPRPSGSRARRRWISEWTGWRDGVV